MVMVMVTEMMRSSSSGLNPNAPIYVPWAYRTVEDFSEQWWELVKSSPCFRDYWIREVYHQQQQEEMDEEDLVDALFFQRQKVEEGAMEKGKKGAGKEMVRWGSKEWRELKGMSECPKHEEKAPKIVNLKRISPRFIQQPR